MSAVRKGRGKAAKSIVLIKAAVEILEEIQPATIRAVCYRLFTMGLIKNMSKNETNKVSTQLVWAREHGMLDWSWVVDETREAERTSMWSDQEQFFRSVIAQYRKDYWRDQSRWVEVWSEKGTVRGTLAPVLDEYGVTFRVMHGYGSATFLHSIAEEIIDSDKRLEVLYVGDWDPSGLHMSDVDLYDRLLRYGALEFHIKRVALSAADVLEGSLPHFEALTKRADPRFAWYSAQYGRYCNQRCWELDALSPVVLRHRVEQEILSRLDVDAWNHAVKVEAAERESMSTILTDWKRISRQAQKYSPGVE